VKECSKGSWLREQKQSRAKQQTKWQQTLKKNKRESSIRYPASRRIFSRYIKMHVHKSVYPQLEESMSEFWENFADSLSALSDHASRSEIQSSDVELFLKR